MEKNKDFFPTTKPDEYLTLGFSFFSVGDFEFHSIFKAEIFDYSLWQLLFSTNVRSDQLFERIEIILELPAILYHLK